MQIKANGITLECNRHGDPAQPALILIRGLGSQLVHWPDELIQGFVARGYHVITFDNRDIGLSQRCPAPGVTGQAQDILDQIASGDTPRAAYTLADMARDVIGLMDALSIHRAHVFGISMGGAITQVLAIDHADRLHSATIVMSAARLADPSALPMLLSHPRDRADFIANALTEDANWGSPGYPATPDYLRDQAARAWDRGAPADGVNRQLLATITAPDRRAALERIALPCLVIHGVQDALIPVEAGRDIAHRIPDADLQLIEGMGHVITPALAPIIVDLVSDFFSRRA